MRTPVAWWNRSSKSCTSQSSASEGAGSARSSASASNFRLHADAGPITRFSAARARPHQVATARHSRTGVVDLLSQFLKHLLITRCRGTVLSNHVPHCRLFACVLCITSWLATHCLVQSAMPSPHTKHAGRVSGGRGRTGASCVDRRGLQRAPWAGINGRRPSFTWKDRPDPAPMVCQASVAWARAERANPPARTWPSALPHCTQPEHPNDTGLTWLWRFWGVWPELDGIVLAADR